ncbi:thymidylate synthase [Candidatus Bathyarchaeota archaeon]|nr:MAG: thymidylate synthase [Candidatus Bathyarchaeota archaeon]
MLKVSDLNLANAKEILTLVFVYSGEFAERVIRNLINDPSFCKSCGLYCDFCKYGVYSYVRNIRAAIELPSPSELPAFIDNPEKYMPKKIPKADLCITSGLHKDLLLELPQVVEKAGIKGLIVPVEDFVEVPSGLRKQLEEECAELGLESAFPKPFCSLEPSDDKPTISRFVNELKVGRPKLEILTGKREGYEVIESVIVRRSSPCGSTWYVARKIIGIETEREILYDAIAKAHHSYPCTATMSVDPEEKEPILHIGGFIIREEVEKALQNAKATRI